MKIAKSSGKVAATGRYTWPGYTWPRSVRLLVSVLVTLHLAAVFLPPFAFQTSPIRGLGSPLAEGLLAWFAPYVDAAYLNHGYAFFAPDPGPSHLLQAKLEFDDGRDPLLITVPDLARHRPRLAYHRHFMLSEHLHSAFAPQQPPAELSGDPQATQRWRAARRMYQRRLEAIQQHLLHKHGADRVTLTRLEHRLLTPYEFGVQRLRPEAAETYRPLPDSAAGEDVR